MKRSKDDLMADSCHLIERGLRFLKWLLAQENGHGCDHEYCVLKMTLSDIEQEVQDIREYLGRPRDPGLEETIFKKPEWTKPEGGKA